MLDPTKIIRAALITARRLPEPKVTQGFSNGGGADKEEPKSFMQRAIDSGLQSDNVEYRQRPSNNWNEKWESALRDKYGDVFGEIIPERKEPPPVSRGVASTPEKTNIDDMFTRTSQYRIDPDMAKEYGRRMAGDVQEGAFDDEKRSTRTPPVDHSLKFTSSSTFLKNVPRGRTPRADGGEIDDGFTPTPDETVALAKQTLTAPRPRFAIKKAGTAPAPAPASGGYQFMKLEEGKANTNSLRAAFDRALERHLALPESERIANSRAAIKTLEPYLGKRKDGTPIALLSQNAKLLKAQAGTKDKEPLTLDDGRGVETIGLSLYPDYREGELKLCPNSASCRDQCLGKHSGQYSQAFTEATEKAGSVSARQRAMRRTKAMVREPEAFAVRLWDDIESAKREAERNGNHLGVRLNTLSDLNPIIHKKLIESQPDVSFYDYTKMAYKPVAENHHYTHSSTGLTQEDVKNPHTNWPKMRRMLDRGDNVAMVFSGSKVLPKFVHDQETGKRYAVVDGKSHDFRPLDIQPEGEDGVIVGLTNLKNTGKRDRAHLDSEGFFVHYDPKKHGETVPVIPQKKED